MSPKAIVQIVKNIAARGIFRMHAEVKKMLRGGRLWTNASLVLSTGMWEEGLRWWMKKKYPKADARKILCWRRRSLVHPGWRVWQEEREEQFLMGCMPVERLRFGWMRRPDCTIISGEPSA
jgi:hypothetical protein